MIPEINIILDHVETNKKVHWHISIGCIIKKLLTIKNCINNPIRCNRRRGCENKRYREDGGARAVTKRNVSSRINDRWRSAGRRERSQ